LILAAGEGTRMRSSVPKVLHELCGVPLILRVLNTVRELKPVSIGVIVGHGGKEVIDRLKGSAADVDFLWQKAQKGSGHAVKTAAPWLKKSLKISPNVMVLCADTPLVRSKTLKSLFDTHCIGKNGATILTADFSNPFGYGRIKRDSGRRVEGIVEEKDAGPEERNIKEVNSGIYFFDTGKLLDAIPLIRNDNAKKEYYLTDVVGLFYGRNVPVETLRMSEEDALVDNMGVNSRVDLALAESILQKEITERWMREGVTILNPASVYIGENVAIGRDAVILPGTMLLGQTAIGERSVIGPNSYVEDSKIGENALVRASYVFGSVVGNYVLIGPFSHLRKGNVVRDGAKIGNFCEIKNSAIGKKTKVPHLSYVGDSALGENVNVGAGTITCNYDGKLKHKTVVGSGVFIGSNVNLVAPVKIGAGAVLGAGSTITNDVPPGALALERSGQVVKKGWAKNRAVKAEIKNEKPARRVCGG